jgi:hypothetical protein
MKSKMHLHKSTNGFIRSHLVGLLAGIGLASIAIFGRNTVESAMSFVKEMRQDGYATTASARVSVSEITFDTSTMPLPPKFWQESEPSIGAPQLFEESTTQPPLIVTSLQQKSLRNPEVAVEEHPPQINKTSELEPHPSPTATPVPKPAFDANALKKALHENLSSVFTGDLPYILLKSGDRLYAGSKLTEGVTLEAISPTAILCTTPVGILKIDSQPDSDSLETATENEKSPLPLDVPKSPDGASASQPL